MLLLCTYYHYSLAKNTIRYLQKSKTFKYNYDYSRVKSFGWTNFFDYHINLGELKMKKAVVVLSLLFVLSVLTVSLLALVSLSSAVPFNEVRGSDIRLNRIFVDQELSVSNEKLVQDVVAGVDLDNIGDYNLEDLKLTVVIPELGVKKSVGPFDVKKDQGTARKVLLELFDDVPTGDYDVRLTVWNNDVYRVKYRVLTVLE